MRKIYLILLTAAIALAMSGCGENGDVSSHPQSNSDMSEAVSDMVSEEKDMMSDLGEDMGDGISDIGEAIGDGVSDLGEGVSELIDDMDGQDDHSSSRDDQKKTESDGAITADTSKDETVETAASVPADTDFAALSNEKQGWGQGVQMDEKNRPLSSLLYQEKYGCYDALFIGPEEKKLYLTFDEGYENGYTASILDTLKEKGVSAVFFVTLDYIEREPELIQRMIDEGHVVGNHSANHPSFPTVSIDERCQEILQVEQIMKDQFGYEDMHLFRPPAGEFSEQVLAQMQSMGYKTVFWSYAYKDWDPNNQMGPDKAIEKVCGALHDGAIYLLHAVSSDNAAILGDFIDKAREQGYTFALL